MSDVIVVNREQLDRIGARSERQAQATQQLAQTLRGAMQEVLTGWAGDSANAFKVEMEERVLPALQRLTEALTLTRQALQQVDQVMRNAEVEGAARFSADSGAPSAAAVVGADKTTEAAGQPTAGPPETAGAPSAGFSPQGTEGTGSTGSTGWPSGADVTGGGAPASAGAQDSARSDLHYQPINSVGGGEVSSSAASASSDPAEGERPAEQGSNLTAAAIAASAPVAAAAAKVLHDKSKDHEGE